MTASLFFSSCAEDGGIYHYILQNGKLTLRSFTPCDRPMYTITEKKQLWVILRDCFDDHTSGLQEYEILDSGTLMPIGEPVSTKGIVACQGACVHEVTSKSSSGCICLAIIADLARLRPFR